MALDKESRIVALCQLTSRKREIKTINIVLQAPSRPFGGALVLYIQHYVE